MKSQDTDLSNCHQPSWPVWQDRELRQEQHTETINFSDEVGNPKSSCYFQRSKILNKVRSFVQAQSFDEKFTFILHGSFSTGEITAFSDIDLLVIIRDSQYSRPTSVDFMKLRQLELLLTRIDPLMHHGVDLIFEDDFLFYDESRLPLDSIKKATLIAGGPSIITTPDLVKSVYNARRRLRFQCHNILNYSRSMLSRTPYKLKCLVSTLFLVPVLLLQAERSIFLYKGESLPLAHDLYSANIDFGVVDIASQIREAWQVSQTTLLLRRFLVPLEPLFPSGISTSRFTGLFFPRHDFDVYDFISRSHQFSKDILNYAREGKII
jgi:predicted nucleotidyltransferase